MPARGGLTLLTFRGIRIGVDYSWFLVLFLVVIWLSGFYRDVLGTSDTGSTAYVLAVISALAFFASILLHELGHALVALRNGIGITSITLWLFGGVAQMDRDSDSPGTEFRIAAAGPAVTLAIAIGCAAAGVALAGSREAFLDAMAVQGHTEISPTLAVLGWLTSINVLVLAFNLIPAFPLDGGRIARAAIWKLTGNRNRATRFAGLLGQGFSYLFVALGVVMVMSGNIVGGVWLGLIGIVLGSSARGAVAQTKLTSRLEGLRVADVMDAEPVAIPAATTVELALDEYFLRYRAPWFPVVDGDGRFSGMIVREAAESVEPSERVNRLAGELAEPDPSGRMQVLADSSVEALLASDALRRLGAIAAVDRDGMLRGMVTIDQVARALRGAIGS